MTNGLLSTVAKLVGMIGESKKVRMTGQRCLYCVHQMAFHAALLHISQRSCLSECALMKTSPESTVRKTNIALELDSLSLVTLRLQ